MSKKKKSLVCLCDPVYDLDAIILNPKCPIHGKKKGKDK
jgi:hypothetical protein